MPRRLRIRLATEADARAIGVLVRRVARQDVLPDQSAAAGRHLMAMMTARAERQRIREGQRYHVAELDGRLAGVVAMRDDRHVFRLFVGRRFRNLGIGRALLRKALADARHRAGTRTFTLYSSAHALGAYVRMGFLKAGRSVPRGPGKVTATPMVYRVPRHN